MRESRCRGLGEGGRPTERDAARPSDAVVVEERGPRRPRGAGERPPRSLLLQHTRGRHGQPKPAAARAGRPATGGRNRAAALQLPATAPVLGAWSLVHGLERHGDVRPRSMTSRGSVGTAPNARRSENIASSKVTIRRPRRALFGEVVLDNPTSVRDRWRCSQGAGSARSVSAASDQAPICTVRSHPSISPRGMGGRLSRL